MPQSVHTIWKESLKTFHRSYTKREYTETVPKDRNTKEKGLKTILLRRPAAWTEHRTTGRQTKNKFSLLRTSHTAFSFYLSSFFQNAARPGGISISRGGSGGGAANCSAAGAQPEKSALPRAPRHEAAGVACKRIPHSRGGRRHALERFGPAARFQGEKGRRGDSFSRLLRGTWRFTGMTAGNGSGSFARKNASFPREGSGNKSSKSFGKALLFPKVWHIIFTGDKQSRISDGRNDNGKAVERQ